MKSKNVTIAEINKALKTLPNPSDVLKTKSATIAIYHKVAGHPNIFSQSQIYKDAICSMDQFCNDEFMERYLTKFRSAFKQLKRDFVSARDYGYSVIEIIDYETFEGKTVPSKFQLCPPEEYKVGRDLELRWMTSQHGQIGMDIMKEFPNKFIWVKNEPSVSKPYGIALLDIVYWVAVGLNGNFDAMLNFAEYDGADKWIGTYLPDATEEQKNELLNALLTLKRDSVTIKPEGTNIELVENKGRGSTGSLYKDINEMLLRSVEKLWFGTDLMMQVQGKGGYSSSQTGVDIREDALQNGADLVIQGYTQLYQYIANINGMSMNDGIEFTLESPRQISKEEAEVDKIYFDMGMKPTPKFFENRGYNTDEFVYSEKTPEAPGQGSAPNPPAATFSESGLSDIFDLYKDDLPK